MAVEIVTKEDIHLLRVCLINDFRKLLDEIAERKKTPLEGYKTKDVRKILGCCQNKLQALRVAGKLRMKKIGGTIYYNPKDVERLLNDGF